MKIKIEHKMPVQRKIEPDTLWVNTDNDRVYVLRRSTEGMFQAVSVLGGTPWTSLMDEPADAVERLTYFEGEIVLSND